VECEDQEKASCVQASNSKGISLDSDSDDDLPTRARIPGKALPAQPVRSGDCPSRPVQLSDDSSDDEVIPAKGGVRGVQRVTKPTAPKGSAQSVSLTIQKFCRDFCHALPKIACFFDARIV
jgi:hypothetical protein